VAITIHPSLAHGFAFSEEAQGYVLTIDQNVLFAAAGQDGDLFAPLFVEPLASGSARCRKNAAASRRCCRTSSQEAAGRARATP
jgi:hypothetical protein